MGGCKREGGVDVMGRRGGCEGKGGWEGRGGCEGEGGWEGRGGCEGEEGWM